MSWHVKRPCDDCPFRKVGGIRLRPDRALEIARYSSDSQGKTFACHKTTGVTGGRQTDQQCAGAIVYAMNLGSWNQAMRMFGRLGLIDRDALEKYRAEIFDNEADMVEANR